MTPSTPNPEVFARPRGSIQWSCPDCGNLHSQDQGFWKRAQIQCRRKGCEHRFRVGVGFAGTGAHRCVKAGKYNNHTANRYGETLPGNNPPMGRLLGPLDWLCPLCPTVQTSDIDFHSGIIQCTGCTHFWVPQLLIYTPFTAKITTPMDWSIPYVQQTPHGTPSPAPSREGPGTPSGSLGTPPTDSGV